MPNNIKNKIEIIGNEEQVKACIEKFSTHYEKEIRRSFDGEIICKNGDKIGWLNDKTNEFKQKDKKTRIGLPEGWEYEYQESWTRFPDFEKIVSRPEILKDTEFHSGIIDRAKNAVGYSTDDNELISSLEKQNRIRDCFTPARKEDIPNIIKCLQAYMETGYFYWYDWNCDNWGTKWNSYQCEKISDNIFVFETAWSNVHNLIEKMSKEFPELTFNYSYADEDTGYNCGKFTFKKGNTEYEYIPEGGSKEAYELAFELRPEYKEDYEFVNGRYEYIESDD